MDFDLDEIWDATQEATPGPVPHMQLHPPPEGCYDDLRDLMKAVNAHAKEQGYAVVIRRSNRKKGVIKNVYLRCDRGGQRNPRHQLRDALFRRHTSTRMTGCEFKAVARSRDEGWILEVEKPGHNHEAISLTGHPVHRKEAMTDAVSDFIDKETRIHVRPGQILNALQLNNPGIPLAIKDVYNEKGKQHRQRLNFKKPIQVLMTELDKKEDWYSAHAEDGVHQLSHLFFANMEFLRLLSLNPEVLIMDCTYKTNRF